MLHAFRIFLIPVVLPLVAYGQSSQLLSGTSWSGTHSPLTKGTEIYFQGDTLYIVDMAGIKPADTYLFTQKGDTVQFQVLDEFSIECRDEVPGRYRISWANNGEKLLFKPMHDPCLQRFTTLISESPWFRKRATVLSRNDWYFLNPEMDKVPGIQLYDAYKLVRFRASVPVRVALVGGRVDAGHPDLRGVLLQDEIKTPPDTIATHMAGIIGALRGNHSGVDGIADQVQITNEANGEEPDQLAEAILQATEKGVKILILRSLTDASIASGKVISAIKAADKKGALVFFPVRESAVALLEKALPPNAVPVIGYDPSRKPRSGLSMLAAPGNGLYSTLPGNQYGIAYNPAAACAVAGGMAAFISSYFPKLTGWQIRQVLLESGRLNIINPGLINLKKASELAIKLQRKKA